MKKINGVLSLNLLIDTKIYAQLTLESILNLLILKIKKIQKAFTELCNYTYKRNKKIS